MKYIDGFTQEKQNNIKVCNGCKIHCTIDATNMNGRFYPTFITSIPTVITNYIDENGIIHHISSNTLPGLDTKEQAIVQARRIAKLCDNYKTR